MAVYNKLLYVVDESQERIIVFDLEGKFVSKFCCVENCEGITINESYIYLSFPRLEFIKIFTHTGNFIRDFKYKGLRCITTLKNKLYIASYYKIGCVSDFGDLLFEWENKEDKYPILKCNDIYVFENHVYACFAHIIYKYDENGNFIKKWDRHDEFNQYSMVILNDVGYVVDTSKRKIIMFK